MGGRIACAIALCLCVVLPGFWLAGAAIVCVGIAQFLITHAANYSHVNNANKYVELRDVAYESYSDPIARPYRGGVGERMEQWSPEPPSSLAPSSSRFAQASESVSQYQYKGRNY